MSPDRDAPKSELKIFVIRNKVSGRSVIGEHLEEGPFERAAIFKEDQVDDGLEFLTGVLAQKHAYYEAFPARVKPKPVELVAIGFVLPEPGETHDA